MTSHAAGAVIHPSHPHRSAIFLALAGIFTVGCIGVIDPLPSTTGAIMITVSTAGAGIDPDGYTLTIDSQPAQRVGINAVVSFGSLVRGEHVVRLDGLSPNCSVTGGNVRSVDVVNSTPGSPLSVSFSVSCAGDGDGTGGWDY